METINNTKVYKLICNKCGKEIVSLSEAQADYNMKAHKITCKGDKDEKNNKNKS